MKWIIRLGIVAVALIALFAIIGFILPTEYEVKRSIVIPAETSKIHPYVNDLAKWGEWMPFYEDPSVKTTLGDKTVGVGANQTWTSSDGDGRVVITVSDENQGIEYDFAFVDGENELPAKASIQYAPKDGGIEVTWTMDGDMAVPVLGGYLAVMMPSLIGAMFEQGLGNLQTLVAGSS